MKINVGTKFITIEEKRCFNCGSTIKTLTKHHGIGQKFKPKYNVIIPLCIKCHRKIHGISKKKPDNILIRFFRHIDYIYEWVVEAIFLDYGDEEYIDLTEIKEGDKEDE